MFSLWLHSLLVAEPGLELRYPDSNSRVLCNTSIMLHLWQRWVMKINPLFAKELLTAQTKCSKDIYICLPHAFDDRSNFSLHYITNVGFGDIRRSHHIDVIGGKGYHWNLFILSPVHFPLPASNDLLGDVLCSRVQTTGARHLCLLFWDLTHRLPQWPWPVPPLSCLFILDSKIILATEGWLSDERQQKHSKRILHSLPWSFR